MPKKLIFPKYKISLNININNILILKQNHRPYNLLMIKHCTVRLTCSLPLRIKKKQNNYKVCCQTHAVNNHLGVTPTLRPVDLLLVDDQHGDLLSETGQLVLQGVQFTGSLGVRGHGDRGDHGGVHQGHVVRSNSEQVLPWFPLPLLFSVHTLQFCVALTILSLSPV